VRHESNYAGGDRHQRYDGQEQRFAERQRGHTPLGG
jgi:hypothetical protein